MSWVRGRLDSDDVELVIKPHTNFTNIENMTNSTRRSICTTAVI